MKVVNIYKNRCDVYGGRAEDGTIPQYTKGWLGNPFNLKDYNKYGKEEGRRKCLEDFSKYFDEKIKNDQVYKNMLLDLKGKSVGCFCKPQACHLDIVAEWVNAQAIVEFTNNIHIFHYSKFVPPITSGPLASKEKPMEWLGCEVSIDKGNRYRLIEIQDNNDGTVEIIHHDGYVGNPGGICRFSNVKKEDYRII